MTELAIRARRADFNRAIAACDLAAIGPILARDCVMVTGSDSAIISGRAGQLKVWRSHFAADDGVSYVRLPTSIVLSAVEPIAMEHGHWQGVKLGAGGDGVVRNSGSYSAKWRAMNGAWVIEAEIYCTEQ